MKTFITGGAGFLGTALVKYYIRNNEVIVYSRDESKHQILLNRFNDDKLKTIIGDVNSPDLKTILLREKPAHIILCHALKQIGVCEDNPGEANRVNVLGTQNIINCLKEISHIYTPKNICYVSTDKAVNPITTYGTTKLLAEKIVTNAATKFNLKTCIVRYGNVISSTGSVIPVIKQQLAFKKAYLTLTNKKMTRFIFTIRDAVQFIDYVLYKENQGNVWIPLLKSMKIQDLFEIYSEQNLIDYREVGCTFKEKLHEILNNDTETFAEQLTYKAQLTNPSFVKLYSAYSSTEYSSVDQLISKSELKKFLEQEELL